MEMNLTKMNGGAWIDETYPHYYSGAKKIEGIFGRVYFESIWTALLDEGINIHIEKNKEISNKNKGSTMSFKNTELIRKNSKLIANLKKFRKEFNDNNISIVLNGRNKTIKHSFLWDNHIISIDFSISLTEEGGKLFYKYFIFIKLDNKDKLHITLLYKRAIENNIFIDEKSLLTPIHLTCSNTKRSYYMEDQKIKSMMKYLCNNCDINKISSDYGDKSFLLKILPTIFIGLFCCELLKLIEKAYFIRDFTIKVREIFNTTNDKNIIINLINDYIKIDYEHINYLFGNSMENIAFEIIKNIEKTSGTQIINRNMRGMRNSSTISNFNTEHAISSATMTIYKKEGFGIFLFDTNQKRGSIKSIRDDMTIKESNLVWDGKRFVANSDVIKDFKNNEEQRISKYYEYDKETNTYLELTGNNITEAAIANRYIYTVDIMGDIFANTTDRQLSCIFIANLGAYFILRTYNLLKNLRLEYNYQVIKNTLPPQHKKIVGIFPDNKLELQNSQAFNKLYKGYTFEQYVKSIEIYKCIKQIANEISKYIYIYKNIVLFVRYNSSSIANIKYIKMIIDTWNNELNLYNLKDNFEWVLNETQYTNLINTSSIESTILSSSSFVIEEPKTSVLLKYKKEKDVYKILNRYIENINLIFNNNTFFQKKKREIIVNLSDTMTTRSSMKSEITTNVINQKLDYFKELIRILISIIIAKKQININEESIVSVIDNIIVQLEIEYKNEGKEIYEYNNTEIEKFLNKIRALFNN